MKFLFLGSKNFVPDNWEALMEGMRQMRKTHPAPVDTMGADACHDKTAPAKVNNIKIPFEVDYLNSSV